MATVFVMGAVSNWAVKMADHLRERADALGALPSKTATETNHVAALRATADFLVGKYRSGSNPEDMVDEILVLGRSVFEVTRGSLNFDTYKPSPTAAKVVAQAGKTGHHDSQALVTEILSQELHDFAGHPRKVEVAAAEARTARDVAITARQKAEEDRAIQAEARARAESELAQSNAEVAELRKLVAFLRANEVTVQPDPIDAEQEPTPESEFPTSEQLEEALDHKRVSIGSGLYLQRRRHEGASDTWYATRLKVGQERERFEWIASATDGKTTISQAAEARQRLIEASKAVV